MTTNDQDANDRSMHQTPNIPWAAASDGEPDNPNPPRPLSGLGVVGWGLVCTAAWLVILLIATAISSAIEGDAGVATESSSLVFVAGQGLAGIIGWFVIPRIVLRRRNSSQLLYWRRPSLGDILSAATALGIIYVTLFIYITIVEALGQDQLVPQSTIDEGRLYHHTSVIIALGIVVIIAAPIYEETFARGFVLGGLRRSWGIVPAFLISAAVFSALHADLGSMIPFAIAGVILGLLYVRTDSLTAPTIAHVGFNVIGFSATLWQQLS